MSKEDKKVDPNLEEVEDKTSKTNETKELDSKTLFYQKKAAQEKAEKEREAREKAEAELAELKAKQEAKKEVPKSNEDSTLQDKIEAIEFTLKHRDLSPDAINTAIKVAKMEGISNEEALKNPMVQAYIEKINEKAKTKDAVPTGIRSSIVTDEEKKANEEMLHKARVSGKAEDWAKVLEKRIN